MGETTAIAWTDHTFNPWIGCARVSPGCQHCYAETLTKRTGMAQWGVNGTRHVTSDAYWRQPLKWDQQAETEGRQHLVFCASLADVFEDRDELAEPRARLFELIEQTPHLTWQLLSKRPENVLDMAPHRWILPAGNVVCDECGSSASLALGMMCSDHRPRSTGWPANVWIGTTVEDQQRADERIPRLLDIPAPVRFLSCEPLLGRVNLSMLRVQHAAARIGAAMTDPITVRTIDWVIVGGESGPGHRPLRLEHAIEIVVQCKDARVPVFFKQVGGQRPTSGGDQLDGRTIKQFPSCITRGNSPADVRP